MAHSRLCQACLDKAKPGTAASTPDSPPALDSPPAPDSPPAEDSLSATSARPRAGRSGRKFVNATVTGLLLALIIGLLAWHIFFPERLSQYQVPALFQSVVKLRTPYGPRPLPSLTPSLNAIPTEEKTAASGATPQPGPAGVATAAEVDQTSSRLPRGAFTVSSEGAIKLTTDQLINLYDDDETRADAWLQGRTLEVTGAIDYLGKEIVGARYVILKVKSDDTFGVKCSFDKERQEPLAGLAAGQQVTIKGQCGGRAGNILLSDCTLQ